jgi:[lysine-biosynthesis-protein LysW]---L-2-aminoadipate ligase
VIAPDRVHAGAVSSTTGIVAVVAWKAYPSNLPLVEEWLALGIRAELLSPPEAHRELGPRDTALLRVDVAATLDGVEPGLRGMAELVERGVRVLNPAPALLAAHDKLATAARLAEAGLPHPVTVHGRRAEEIEAMEPPFVLKPRFGSWGEDLTLCTDAKTIRAGVASVRGRAWFRRHGALIQELVPGDGRDLRVLVAGGRVIGALERRAGQGEWRTNEALGASAQPVHPPATACALAVAAARAIGADLVGVDLLDAPSGGFTIIEVNGAVDFDRTDSLPGRDVYADAAAALGLHGRRGALARVFAS